MKCPKCGKELKRIDVGNTQVSASLQLREDIYIPVFTVLDYVEFLCPFCREPLPEETDLPISKNLVYACFDAMHKPVLIDLQNLPINVKEIEFQEKVAKMWGKTMKISRGREVKLEPKKKSTKKQKSKSKRKREKE
jgi:predicted RNA-binding Zn-ribbon protein involved in translation (DUF1610 family)